jgi:hypothetical protein
LNCVIEKVYQFPQLGSFVFQGTKSEVCRLPVGLAPSCFTAHKFDGFRVLTPGADTVNQAVHPSGVGKLVAVSIQWVTAVEDCEGEAWSCTMAGVWTMQLEAETTTRWFPTVSTGDLRISNC